MKKTIFFIISLFILLQAKQSPSELFKQIKESKNSLASASQQKTMTNKQLTVIAAKIKKLKNEIAAYDKKLNKLNDFLSNQEKKYQDSMAEINGIDRLVKNLDKDIEAKNKEFAQMVSRQLGGIVAQNKSGEKNEKSVIMKEVYDRYKSYNQQELLKLSRNIEQKNALKKNLLARRDAIAKSIKDVQEQKNLYLKEKQEKQQLLKKLAIEENKYSQRLKSILRKQTVIRLTLTKLKLLKEDAVNAAKKREKELRKRIKELKKIKFVKDNSIHPVAVNKVKQYGSSYINSNIYKYRGPKTIAPLKNAKIIKPFGTFIDQIYKIRSHSDSVTLISKAGDNRVYNVLNGEVAYIGQNSMLGKLVVIKHDNGLHTIYADLSKFSPFIKVGMRIKKGSIIGKVKRKLIFEATKNGQFINPVRLINL